MAVEVVTIEHVSSADVSVLRGTPMSITYCFIYMRFYAHPPTSLAKVAQTGVWVTFYRSTTSS